MSGSGKPKSKPGEHGRLYYYQLVYDGGPDSGSGEMTWHAWAYSLEHAVDKFQSPGEDAEGFRLLRAAVVPESGLMHRAHWTKLNGADMKGSDEDFDEPDDDELFNEPDEGDWTTEDHRRFYADRELVLDLPADTGECEMWAAIAARMKKDNLWPNVWWISDHGNAHLMANPGNKVCRPPRKKKGKKKRGAKLGGLSRDFTRDCGPSGCEIKRR